MANWPGSLFDSESSQHLAHELGESISDSDELGKTRLTHDSSELGKSLLFGLESVCLRSEKGEKRERKWKGKEISKSNRKQKFLTCCFVWPSLFPRALPSPPLLRLVKSCSAASSSSWSYCWRRSYSDCSEAYVASSHLASSPSCFDSSKAALTGQLLLLLPIAALKLLLSDVFLKLLLLNLLLLIAVAVLLLLLLLWATR